MTTRTIGTQTYEAGRVQGAVQTLRELGVAAGRLAAALVASLQRGAGQPRSRAAVDEANRLRALARQHMARNPGFAADLFAAADRHERDRGI